MRGLEIPGHLELLLAGEPVLDIYAAGPWRVPDGLVGEVFGRARELAASDEARSVRARLSEDWLPDATAVAPELLTLAGFLCGSAAVCGGTCAYLNWELVGGFLAEPDSFPRDPLKWQEHWRRVTSRAWVRRYHRPTRGVSWQLSALGAGEAGSAYDLPARQ